VKSHFNELPSLFASVLAGSWRSSPQELQLSETHLAEIIPQLLGSMSGGLAWWKIRNTDLKTSAAGLELHEAYRFHAILTLVREHAIKKVLTLLYRDGIEPILVKGWAAARTYPEPGLRPYGDIDLVVRPDQHSKAAAAISAAIAANEIEREYYIDLHRGFETLDDHSYDELYSRSMLAKLDDIDIRVLSPEDHLRVLCVHLLHHNAFRPLWLCDIGAAAEGRASDFDWDRCLGVNRRRADWVACVIGLAHVLLGAEVVNTPVEPRAGRLPTWLVENVLKQWESPYSLSQAPVTHRAPMAKYLRDPRGLLKDLGRRWPKPIEATVYMGGPFNELPRWPFQVGECISRTAKFIVRLSLGPREGK
jgi:putative nucleotidyltransferase-like protein